MDDHRIRIRNIKSRLNDRRRHKHIGIAVDKIKHNLLELVLRHLPVRVDDICGRNELLNLSCNLLDILDAVIYIVDLSAPRKLTVHRLADHLLVVLHHIGLDRNSVNRRFFEHAHIADSDETHVQGTRNRCRRHRQNIDIFLELFDFLFVRDTKALFLIDDQKTEILEFHIF